MVAAAIGIGMFTLFISQTVEMTVRNIQSSIMDQKVKENDELISVVIAKSVYRAIQEEKEKEKGV
jgi:predicted transcriptional regulator